MLFGAGAVSFWVIPFGFCNAPSTFLRVFSWTWLEPQIYGDNSVFGSRVSMSSSYVAPLGLHNASTFSSPMEISLSRSPLEDYISPSCLYCEQIRATSWYRNPCTQWMWNTVRTKLLSTVSRSIRGRKHFECSINLTNMPTAQTQLLSHPPFRNKQTTSSFHPSHT